MKLTPGRKSPLRDLHARRSVLLQQMLENERAQVFFSCGMLALLALAEGASALLSGPRLVVAWLVALLATAGYSAYHLRKLRGAVGELKSIALDEQLLQAQLAGLGVVGARVFSNVPCARHVVPLVIVSQHGVYAADVRIASPSPAPVKTVLDEQRFRYGGVTITPNPMPWISERVQALQQVLRIGRTDDVVVRPLVIIAGAAIEVERLQGAPDVSVVSAESLEQFMKAQPEEFSVIEVTMHAMRLAAHIKQALRSEVEGAARAVDE
jgi:hypothetical protein